MSQPDDCKNIVTVHPDGTTVTRIHCDTGDERPESEENSDDDREPSDGDESPDPLSLIGGVLSIGKTVATGFGSAVKSILPSVSVPEGGGED